jgi:putative DNA methylase
MPQKHRNFQPPVYGMSNMGDLFTSRQLVALTTLCDLIGEVKQIIRQDAIESGMAEEDRGLEDGGRGSLAYAESVCIYLAFSISKLLDRCCSLVTWFPQRDSIYHAFGRQALPMTWDFAEANPLADGAGSFINTIKWEAEVIESFRGRATGVAHQVAAQDQQFSDGKVVSTDPPYYDNINYADLSDFFYVWLRRSLRGSFPRLLSTISVPKAEELVASPNRHGSKELAESFFMTGMTEAMQALSKHAHPAVPVTIYYAFKQSETKSTAGTSSTGWETFLEAVFRAGFSLTGTWPMRTELGNRLVGKEANALASSIILVCRPRNIDAQPISRRDFIRELNQILPEALDEMTKGVGDDRAPLAPVDLSQAIIGPGMAVFSKYSAVLEADGSPMTVRTALQLINRFLAEDDFDADTQFCLHWFEQYGWETGKFGEADTLSRAKGTSVDGVKQAGVIQAAGGNVRLLKWAEYPSVWDPKSDQRLPIWEVLHQLIRVFNTEGETGAAAVFAAVQSKAEAARQLAYRLYTLCERKNWAEDARAYNEVVTSWSGIEAAAAMEPALKQGELFE